MPIVALPQATARAIGSTSIISDQCSIVKELLDNALDASASSISIEITPDTVALIQVKDNGHGIPPSDHPLVCKRAFTSKIHTVEDLRNVGGKSLGFRGEALASAAEVSGSLTFATRIEAESVGSALKYGRNGELISMERVSHPVGTTVRISDLFKRIPVRRQTAIKSSKKTLLKIRKMLQEYAMARPCTRLSFRVLTSMTVNGNWMYAPGKDATYIDAALKIAGTEVASRCIMKKWPILQQTNTDTQGEGNSEFELVALLPESVSDIAKCNNSGQYISIDGRPVSVRRGVGQSIVKLYRSYLRSTTSGDKSSPTIIDPFLCIHIQCSEGSYDVNVEPSKDDVLFGDQQALLSLVEDLFQDTYGDSRKAHLSQQDPAGQDRANSNWNGQGIVKAGTHNGPTLLPQLPNFDSGQGVFETTRSFVPSELPRHNPLGPRSSVGRGYNNVSSNDSNIVSTPSRITTANAPDKQQASSRCQTGTALRLFQQRGKISAERHTSPHLTRHVNTGGTCLLTPVSDIHSPPSDTASRSPLFNHTPPSVAGLSQISLTTPVRSLLRQQQRERDRERYGNGSLDTWFLKSSQAARTPAANGDLPEAENGPSLSQLTKERFGSKDVNLDESVGVGLVDAIRGFSQGLDQLRTPLCTPTTNAGPANKRRELPVLERWSARLYNTSDPDHNPELQKALEFETRKKAAIQERRMQVKKNPGASGSSNSPHQSRYLAARAALGSEPVGLGSSALDGVTNLHQATKPILSPHDPRSYLMRLQSTKDADAQNGSKLKRITLSKLPFEKIFEGHYIHSVNLTWPAELSFVRTSFRETSKIDLYTQSGENVEAFTLPDIDAAIKIWDRQLSALTDTHYRLKDSSDAQKLRFDFSGIARISDDIASTTTI